MRQLGRMMRASNQHLRALSERALGCRLCKLNNKHTSSTWTTHQADHVSFFLSANEQLEAFLWTNFVWNKFLTGEKPPAKFWQEQSIASDLFHLKRKLGLGQRELSSCGLLQYQATSKIHQNGYLHSPWHTQGKCPASIRHCPLGFSGDECSCSIL